MAINMDVGIGSVGDGVFATEGGAGTGGTVATGMIVRRCTSIDDAVIVCCEAVASTTFNKSRFRAAFVASLSILEVDSTVNDPVMLNKRRDVEFVVPKSICVILDFAMPSLVLISSTKSATNAGEMSPGLADIAKETFSSYL